MAGFDPERRDEVVGEFLGGGPRSEAWRLWREALEGRLAALKKERQALGEGGKPADLDAKIAEIEAQIDALATEEIISEFVESEVDLSLNSAEDEGELGAFREDDLD